MTTFRLDSTEISENTATLAYALIALMSATFDFEILCGSGLTDDYLAVRDDASGNEYFRLAVSPVMGELLVAVLKETGIKISETQGESEWSLQN